MEKKYSATSNFEEFRKMYPFYDYLRQYIGNYEYWIEFLKPRGFARPDVVDYEIDLESIKEIDYNNYYNNPVKLKDLPEPMQKVAESCLLWIIKRWTRDTDVVLDVEVVKKSYNLL